MIDELVLGESVQKEADFFAKKYNEQFQQLKGSPLAKFGKIGIPEIYGLGKQLYRFDQLKKRMQERGNIADLGELPKFAYDVIVTAFGGSTLNLFAGTQPISSSHGNVYVKQLVASLTRGNVTDGQTLIDPTKAPDVFAENFAGEKSPQISIGQTTTSVGPYTYTIVKAPIRPNTFKIVAGTAYGTDNGQGKIIGWDLQGTIDYVTGAVVINFKTAPTSGTNMLINFSTNLEESGNYAKLSPIMSTIPINAEVFVIGQELGMLQSFEAEQMFGEMMDDEATQDLSDCLMREISQTLIDKFYMEAINGGASNLTTWEAIPQNAQTEYLYRMTLPYALAKANKKLAQRLGRGGANVYLAGYGFCSYIETLDGFMPSDISTSGPHVYGTYNGKIVIRCPQMTDNDCLMVYTGTGMFDKPGVWAPYMPLATTQAVPVNNNILKSQRICVTYGGVEIVIGRAITLFRITETPLP